MKHTPGPWKIKMAVADAYPSCVIASDSMFVAQTVGGNDLANACLIAAAPDLLAALQSCRMHIETLERMHGHELPEGEAMREAIAKATGEVV